MMYQVISRLVFDTRGQFAVVDFTNRPSPTIVASGPSAHHYQVHYYLTDKPPKGQQMSDKPEYKVPSMAEISALPWNGYNVVSTFSGAGGSCLGYRMAGYRVLWANEFEKAARDVYKVNHPDSHLDGRDIRTVSGPEILEQIGLKVGELDLFDGSPPCDSFSTAGKREKQWGKVKDYGKGHKQRTDDLFFDYTRLLREMQPKTFVAENVRGLVIGKAKGYFKLILRELKDCGYNVRAKVLDAQWLGVPQQRQRVIFIGVRNDLGLAPVFPNPLPYRYSVKEAIPWIIKVRKGEGFGHYRFDDAEQAVADTVGTTPASGNNKDNTAFVVEAETDISKYAIGDEWDNLKPGQVSKKYTSLIKADVDRPSFVVTAAAGSTSTAGVVHPTEKRKFSIAELKRIGSFPDDFILLGSYSDQWARVGYSVPPVMMSHVAATIRDEILGKLPQA